MCASERACVRLLRLAGQCRGSAGSGAHGKCK